MLPFTCRSRQLNKRIKSNRIGALHDGHLNPPWDDMVSTKMEKFISDKSAPTLRVKARNWSRGRVPGSAPQLLSRGEVFLQPRRSPTSTTQARMPISTARKDACRCLHKAWSAGPDALQRSFP